LKHDVRRVWECPLCRRRAHSGGQVVTLRCGCLAGAGPDGQPWMRLVEEAPRLRRKTSKEESANADIEYPTTDVECRGQ
jgi:hypothetical protein